MTRDSLRTSVALGPPLFGIPGLSHTATSVCHVHMASVSQPTTSVNPDQFPYTCIGCSLAFSDATFQREHYQVSQHTH